MRLQFVGITFKQKELVESRSQIVEKAFEETIAFLEGQLGESLSLWSWGNVHQIEFKHPFGEIEWLKPIFTEVLFLIMR